MSAKAQVAAGLFAALWKRYRQRVPYVQAYERLVRSAGAVFANDHVAFRTFASQEPAFGLFRIARIFESLGYSAEGCYAFPDKHLSSIHYRHPDPALPKVFLSELRVWELSLASQRIIDGVLKGSRAPIPLKTLTSPSAKKLLPEFTRLPWRPPQKKDVLALNEESQFAAWVALFGHEVNHFTCLVNAHQVEGLADIEKTVAALRGAGVPMKAEIEGAPGSKLRQSSTEAASVRVAVREGKKSSMISWPYAYFEIAERGYQIDPATGQSVRFEGFLGGQAAQLFEMTRRK